MQRQVSEQYAVHREASFTFKMCRDVAHFVSRLKVSVLHGVLWRDCCLGTRSSRRTRLLFVKYEVWRSRTAEVSAGNLLLSPDAGPGRRPMEPHSALKLLRFLMGGIPHNLE